MKGVKHYSLGRRWAFASSFWWSRRASAKGNGATLRRWASISRCSRCSSTASRRRQPAVDLLVDQRTAAGVFRFAPGAVRLDRFRDDRHDARHGPAFQFQHRAVGSDRQRQHEPLDGFVLFVQRDVVHGRVLVIENGDSR